MSSRIVNPGKFISITSSAHDDAHVLYALDSDGNVWKWIDNFKCWKLLSNKRKSNV